MALLMRVLRALVASVARASGLFVALFVAYLLWSRAWPAYRTAAHLAAQRPQLQQLVDQTARDLAKRKTAVAQLEVRLAELSQKQYRQLAEHVSELELALNDQSEELQRLTDELSAAVTEHEKYCRTWNPLKRWMCREVEARTDKTREVVEPLLSMARASYEQLATRLEETQRTLAQLDGRDVLDRAEGSDALLLRAALAERKHGLDEVKHALADAERQLNAAVEADSSPWGWLQRELVSVAPNLLVIVVLVLTTPFLHRALAYFVFMPWVERAKLINLINESQGRVESENAQRSVTLIIEPGEKCWARADYVRPVEGHTRSQVLFDWRAPLVSYASGLSILTRIEAPRDAERPLSTTLASPEHSDSYLAVVEFEHAPGFVFHPRHLVAVTGDVELWTQWRVWSWHAWATGQLRYIGVRGTGRCVFEGFGDLVTAHVNHSRQRIEQELVVAFDARLAYGTARTETFLPYLLGRTPLVDDVFVGHGVYLWQKNTRRQTRNVAQRSFDALFGAVGKLLGF